MRIFFAETTGFCLNSAWLAADLIPKRGSRRKPCAFHLIKISNFNCLFVAPTSTRKVAQACCLMSSLTAHACAEHPSEMLTDDGCFCFLGGNNSLSLPSRTRADPPKQKTKTTSTTREPPTPHNTLPACQFTCQHQKRSASDMETLP